MRSERSTPELHPHLILSRDFNSFFQVRFAVAAQARQLGLMHYPSLLLQK